MSLVYAQVGCLYENSTDSSDDFVQFIKNTSIKECDHLEKSWRSLVCVNSPLKNISKLFKSLFWNYENVKYNRW